MGWFGVVKGQSWPMEITPFNRVHMSYLALFLRYREILLKNRRFILSHLYLASSLGWPIEISPRSFALENWSIEWHCFRDPVFSHSNRLYGLQQTDRKTNRHI